MRKMFSKFKWTLFAVVCGAMVFCGGGCNDFSSRESVDAGRPILGGVTPFTLDAPTSGWNRPANDYAFYSTLNLERKKLKVTVTGKHAKEKPSGIVADGLKFEMVDWYGKTSDEYAVGWFGTEGSTLVVTYDPKDGTTDGVPNNCDFSNIYSLNFKNYSYVVASDWDCVEGSGVELTVTEVKYEVID